MQMKRSQFKTPRSHIYRHFINGVVLTILLMCIKWGLEHWEFGRQIEQMTYNMLQIQLSSHFSMASLPITIVDINGVTPVPIQREGKTELVTPREPLLKIVNMIAQQKPRSIGIDLNFSPTPYSYVTPSDPVLFERLLNIRQQGIPVYVGIYESVVFDPGRWLMLPKFKPLAAYITVPKPEHTEPATKIIEWVQPAGVPERCYSLSHSLAKTEHKPILWPLQWAVKRATDTKEEAFTTSEFLIDYAPLQKLIDNRLITDSDKIIAQNGSRIANNIVLVGRATPGLTTDQFNLPGRGMPVPGIYVHAAATNTLLQAPLFRLTPQGRIAADALAALLVFVPFLFIQLYYSQISVHKEAINRLQQILTVLVIIAILFIGHFLVYKTRLMWTDYLMVIGALLLHSPMERIWNWSLEGFRFAQQKAWLSAIFKNVHGKRGGKNEKKN
jgi:CHASE2 domain-containing sensor protein